MGEKSGGLTNMIIVVVALVAILLVVDTAFPELTKTVTDDMQGVVESTFGSYNPSDGVSP
ncbi:MULTISPECIES: hypothetical protein [Bacillati]|uniref:Uncharacterized protein n=2 Tax=Bacillati TaxID=1783272 RepID=A0A6N7R312_9BACI|nr:hypothetical protein [Gracilibacillus thailandensis]MRI66166.1 hypothetical protein [Gracilibacillus thailandensis]